MGSRIEPLIDADTLRAGVRRLAADVAGAYEGQPPVVIGILNGAVRFMMDLLASVPAPLGEHIDYDFLDAKSYSGTRSAGRVELSRDLVVQVSGRPVLVVDGIVDSGRTVRRVVDHLRRQRAESVAVCTLLDKRARREVEVKLDFVGFPVDDVFVVGYGLDRDQRYRSLSFVGALVD